MDEEQLNTTLKALFKVINVLLGITVTLIGAALICASLFLLGHVCILIYQAIHAPEQVKLVQFIIDQLKGSDQAVYGSLMPPTPAVPAGNEVGVTPSLSVTAPSMNKATFDVHLGETLRTIIYLWLGVKIVYIVGSLLKEILASGVNILRIGLNMTNPAAVPDSSQAPAKP